MAGRAAAGSGRLEQQARSGARKPAGTRRGGSAGDEQLVERVLAGEQSAFDGLYERYLPRVSGFVRKRLSNPADTEEAVQDVFIAVFSSLASFRGDAPFAAWVLGIARRTVANRFKRKHHPTIPLDHEEPESTNRWDPMLPYDATPDEQYECRERLARIESAATRHLSGEQRQLFHLHHVQHQSITEIAASLQKSEDAVKSGLYRTRKLLLAG
jgi:RNA polymerase sigma-70 factor (ECF subfamily)